MQERTVYLETPISDPPKKSGIITAISFGGTQGSFYFDHKRPNFNSDDRCWLRPVLVTEVPDDEEIRHWARKSTDNLGDTHNEATEIYGKKIGARWMRDQLLPHIALLKEENTGAKNQVAFWQSHAENQQKEIASLKARVAELEGEDKATHTQALDNAYHDMKFRTCSDCGTRFKSSGRCPECSPMG